MMWNADFTWLVQPGRDVPIMSGGLLALSKKWWEERYGEMMVSTCFNLQSGNVWQSYMPSSINQVQYGFLQIKHNFFTIHTFTGGRSHGLRAPPYSARCLPRSPRRPPANSRVCPGAPRRPPPRLYSEAQLLQELRRLPDFCAAPRAQHLLSLCPLPWLIHTRRLTTTPFGLLLSPYSWVKRHRFRTRPAPSRSFLPVSAAWAQCAVCSTALGGDWIAPALPAGEEPSLALILAGAEPTGPSRLPLR